jgi:hypothetical protein
MLVLNTLISNFKNSFQILRNPKNNFLYIPTLQSKTVIRENEECTETVSKPLGACTLDIAR